MIKWVKAANDADLHLSAVTLGEIQAGIELTRDQDPVKADEIEDWANQVAGVVNILPMDAPRADYGLSSCITDPMRFTRTP